MLTVRRKFAAVVVQLMTTDRTQNVYLLGFLAGSRLKLRPDDSVYPINPHPEGTDAHERWSDGFGDAILNRGPLAARSVVVQEAGSSE